MNNKDFVVWLDERYNQTKEEFEKVMSYGIPVNEALGLTRKLRYEETSCRNIMPNVNYDKLFVGAHLYLDTNPINKLGTIFNEIEVTHLYGGVMFYKILEGKYKGEETYLSKILSVF